MLINAKDFDASFISKVKLMPKPKGNQGGRRKDIFYKDIICAFDIETTRLDDIDQTILYIWQFDFYNGEEHKTIIGRTWEEYLEFLNKLEYQLGETEYLVIYDHNLSYEFQFLRGIYNFGEEEVFALDSRKILKCRMFNHFEYRCSYIHSNMSLGVFLDKMGVEHKKTSLDYNVKRYPWTELTEEELEYCINDVIGLTEAIYIEIKHDKDNLYTIPLTSTGYVRRDAKKSMRKVSHRFVQDQLPNDKVYVLLREAFRGGNTHANRYYAGKIIPNVYSWDRSSSYPDVLCNCKFPVREFTPVKEWTIERVLELVYKRNKPVIFRIIFKNIRLIDRYTGCPYLSKDKSRKLLKGIYDNGRVLEAELLETTLTDIDFKIIMEQYEWDNCEIFDLYDSGYGYLPRPLIDTIIKYYRIKTELKGVDGQELYYMKSKNKLNSLYGMMAQDPVKQSIKFVNGEFIQDDKSIEELLARHNRKAFLTYAWGVWTTAWARLRLQEGINLVGRDFVYCDTDSVKYIGDYNKDWLEYNLKRQEDSLRSGAYADEPNGKRHYMGVYESEGLYDKFSTLGAKKYIAEKHGDLEITIAGVNKKKGAKELEKHGGMKAFKTGFIFKEAGGSELIYNDYPDIKEIKIDGHTLKITSNVTIKPSTYTLGITNEYEDILKNADLYNELMRGLRLDLKLYQEVK